MQHMQGARGDLWDISSAAKLVFALIPWPAEVMLSPSRH